MKSPIKAADPVASGENETMSATRGESAGPAGVSARYERGDHLFRQGDRGDTVMYLQRGGVRLSVVSTTGREGVVATLTGGAFLGEEVLAGRTSRLGTAVAIVPTEIQTLRKEQMIRLLRTNPLMSDRFIAHMLSRHIRLEADLADQLLNSSEQRLARRLCLLARDWNLDQSHQRLPPEISQRVLADMVGTTRERVNLFLGRFRRRGFIEYDHGIRVNRSLEAVLPFQDPAGEGANSSFL